MKKCAFDGQRSKKNRKEKKHFPKFTNGDKLNHELQERLRYRRTWIKQFLIYKQHSDITDKVTDQIYSELPVLSWLLKIYFLPTIIWRFIFKAREWHDYNRCMKEIKILKAEIKKNDDK